MLCSSTSSQTNSKANETDIRTRRRFLPVVKQASVLSIKLVVLATTNSVSRLLTVPVLEIVSTASFSRSIALDLWSNIVSLANTTGASAWRVLRFLGFFFDARVWVWFVGCASLDRSTIWHSFSVTESSSPTLSFCKKKRKVRSSINRMFSYTDVIHIEKECKVCFSTSQTLLQSIEKDTKDKYTIIYNLFSISLKGLKGTLCFLFYAWHKVHKFRSSVLVLDS